MRIASFVAIFLAACSRSTGPDPATIGPASKDYDAAPAEVSPPASTQNAAGAEDLFMAARKDMADGKLAEACQKFSQSYALDPAVGTLMNLAECEHKLGDEAKACEHWALALKMIRAKSPSNDARAKLVEDRLSKCP